MREDDIVVIVKAGGKKSTAEIDLLKLMDLVALNENSLVLLNNI
jgi:hypothetical protein